MRVASKIISSTGKLMKKEMATDTREAMLMDTNKKVNSDGMLRTESMSMKDLLMSKISSMEKVIFLFI